MSADPVPDAPLTPELAAFFVAYAAAFTARDVEALLALFAFPHVLVDDARRIFIEDEAEARANIDGLLEGYARNGVASATVEHAAMLALPDGAARVAVRWRLAGADGADVLRFPTLYTLADDDGWRVVAIEAQGEVDAWAGAGWA